MWLGGGIFNDDRVIAICYRQEVFKIQRDYGHKLYCRSIYTIFKEKLFHYLPHEEQEKFLPMWYPEKLVCRFEIVKN